MHWKIPKAAEACARSTAQALNQVERAELDQDMIFAQERLDDKTFKAVWSEGCRMTLEQAVEFALQSSS
jgi:hypothetical protein